MLHYDNFLKLSDAYKLQVANRNVISQLQKQFPFRITSHYLSLVDWSDPGCPIARQAFPSVNEVVPQNQKLDTCGEGEILKYNCLLQVYKDRALLLVSNKCFTYCRFCTRKWLFSSNNSGPTMDDIYNARVPIRIILT